METVKSLRQKGYKVRVLHIRNHEYTSEPLGKFDMMKQMSSKGGNTRIELSYVGLDAVGEATCHPKDNYNKKEGVRIALERALADMQEQVGKNGHLWTISIDDGFGPCEFKIRGSTHISQKQVADNASEFLKGQIVSFRYV